MMNEGSRRRASLTFLFTDIEGSTRRWEADADAMRAAWRPTTKCCGRRSRRNAAGCSSYTGDGVCAVFASPRSAVDAAVAAQRALELPVRMGIATGEAELRGDDYFGAVLNRAARVMAAGHGGQILLDGATAALLSGVDLVDLGGAAAARYRQVRRPLSGPSRGPAYRIPAAEDARSDAGKSAHADHQLRRARGRNRRVEATLKAHRLVTLTGVGGVGKTRLALEVASAPGHDFPRRVWVIELARRWRSGRGARAVAAVLGITQQPGMSLADSIAAALEGRSRLLVFDNCEHVLDAAAEIDRDDPARSATVKIIATSREGLRLADEQLWSVPSLDKSQTRVRRRPVRRTRASGRRRSISLTTRRRRPSEICRRLDGIPLAIELAASRMQSMTVTEVRDRLDDRFRLLVGVAARTGTPPDAAPRRAMVLRPTRRAEKSLLARCSVFAGGFDLPARARSRTPTTNLPHWIFSMLWCGSRFWSRTGHRSGHDSRCWRRSANSPRNSSFPPVTPTELVMNTPATSRPAKSKSSLFGIAGASAKPTIGLLANCPIYVPRSAGPSNAEI